MIITLFGPDGSGKTTLAKLFRGYMFSRSLYAYISWLRGSYLFASFLAKFLYHFTVLKDVAIPAMELPYCLG